MEIAGVRAGILTRAEKKTSELFAHLRTKYEYEMILLTYVY